MSPAIYRCQIRNTDARVYQEVRLEFFATFFPGVKAQGHSTRGERYIVPISLLGPGEDYVFYIRSDSPNGASVHFPGEASVRGRAEDSLTVVAITWDRQSTPNLDPLFGVEFDGAHPSRPNPAH